MGRSRSVPKVFLFLFTFYFCALQGNAQQINNVFEPVKPMLDNRQESQVNQAETSNIPLPSNQNSQRLSNVISYKHRENESDTSENKTSFWSAIKYRIVVLSLIFFGLLVALGLFSKGLYTKMKQKRIQEEFSMTYHDAKLSSQFLTDLSESERAFQANLRAITEMQDWVLGNFSVYQEKMKSDTNPSDLPPKTAADKPVVIDIPTARAPIPSQISLTSPKGETKKAVWQADDFVRVDLSDDSGTPRSSQRPRRTSSLPSLSSDQSSSSPESRDSSRRDAVLLYSDDEDFLADLKKKRKKEKKTWKKIMKASQLRAS